MGYLALYRKYRPKDLNDVVGQTNIVKILETEIEKDKISHAYLFSGPRGTGKTTIAKILGNLVNCENVTCGKPCGKCNWCLNQENVDIIEIDAASNNGVEEIREIREKVSLMPSIGKYKVYIIDEVHMLTIQAFNALLKTLEEPPKHIIFILATTDLHKVPLTISSRCQKFNFKIINQNEMFERLSYIADKENINISKSGLQEIAIISDGGMRDAINLLDQLSVYDFEQITDVEVDQISDYVTYKDIFSLMESIIKGNRKELIDMLEQFEKNNINIKMLFIRISDVLKDILFKKNSICENFDDYSEYRKKTIMESLENFSEVQIVKFINKLNELYRLSYNDNFSKILLTTTFFDFINQLEQDDLNRLKNKREEQITSNKEKQEEKLNNIDVKKIKDIEELKRIRVNNTFVSASKEKLNRFNEKWEKLDNYVYEDMINDQAIMLKDCMPVLVGDDNVILLSKFESISKKINNNIEDIEKIIERIYNNKYKIISLSNLEWEEQKQRYIYNLKSNYKYEYIKEVNEKDKSKVSNVSKSLNSLIEVVGNEIIEYRLEEE